MYNKKNTFAAWVLPILDDSCVIHSSVVAHAEPNLEENSHIKGIFDSLKNTMPCQEKLRVN